MITEDLLIPGKNIPTNRKIVPF